VGASVGSDVGSGVGASVGSEVGTGVGASVGSEVGASVGSEVGARVVGGEVRDGVGFVGFGNALFFVGSGVGSRVGGKLLGTGSVAKWGAESGVLYSASISSFVHPSRCSSSSPMSSAHCQYAVFFRQVKSEIQHHFSIFS
jgi:hypothetical protein